MGPPCGENVSAAERQGQPQILGRPESQTLFAEEIRAPLVKDGDEALEERYQE